MRTSARSLRLPRVSFAGICAAIIFALLGLTLTLGSTAANAHDELVGYGAEKNASGVVELTFSFNNTIMDIGAEIIAVHDNGTDLTDGDPVVSGRDVIQPLIADLPEGQASVAWRVVSSDGHPISEMFTLQIAADGTAKLTPGAAENDAVDPEDAASEDAAAEDSADSGDATDNGSTAFDSDDMTVDLIQAPTTPIGGLIGVGIAVVAIILVVIFLVRRGKKTHTPPAADDDASVG